MPDAALTSDGAPKESAVLERLEEIEEQLGVIQTHTARSTVDWYKRILDTVQAVVVMVGVVVAVQQLIQVRKNSYQTAYDTVSKEWLQMDRYFVEKKELRPYFFEKKPIDPNDSNYAEVDATAHYVLNFVDYAIAADDQLGPPNSGSFIATKTWHQYLQKTYFNSPIICDNLKRFGEGYSDITWELAENSCRLPHRPRQRRCESWLDGALCWLGLK